MTCTRSKGCIIGKGQRHHDDCPRRRATSGLVTSRRVSVDVDKLERLREALGLSGEATSNQVLEVAAERVEG